MNGRGSYAGKRVKKRRGSVSAGKSYRSYPSGARNSSGRRRKNRRRVRLFKALALWAVCIFLIGAIAFGTFRAVSALTASKKGKLRAQGIEQIQAEDWQGAITTFDQALEASGKKDVDFQNDVLSYRAEAELHLQDYQAALHSYELIWQQDESQLSALYMQSVCQGKLGNKEQAVALFREALSREKEGKHSPGYEEALASAGASCIAGEDYITAMSLYEEALKGAKEGNGQERIYNQMGICQLAEEDYEGALDSFNKGYDALVTRYNAGSGAELSGAASAITQENTADWELLKELSYNQAVAMEYLQQYKEALSRFETYVEVFGQDEAVQHEIDFLKTRQGGEA